MGKHKWDLLYYIFDTEVNSFDVAVDFHVTPNVASIRLLRAFNQGWLQRRKFEGIYYYRLSRKAWDFWYKFGTFTQHQFYR